MSDIDPEFIERIALATEKIVDVLEEISDNTHTEDVNELAQREINDLKQTIRNFGIELQMSLDNPPAHGLEMARRMRELAARMSSFGIPEAFSRRKG